MDLFSVDMGRFKTLLEALLLGLLVGVERYKDRKDDEKKPASLRTFVLFSLLGVLCGFLGDRAFTLATFAALAALLWLGYYRSSATSVGQTTEFAGLLVFWLGYLLHSFEVLAISAGIVLTIVLASKHALHDFARERISETEFYDTLKFLVVVFVVFPVLPDRDFGPYHFFNPTRVWSFVVLVSSIGYAGYFLMRWLGGSRGLELSGVVGGLVSTTAVTLSLAERTRRAPEHARICGTVGVMANAVQFPRLLLLVWVVDPELGRFVLVPLVGMCAAGLAGAWLLGRWRTERPEVEFPLSNPYSLRPALQFGLALSAIFLLARAAEAWLGQGGILLASALAGSADASAISLTVAQLAGRETLSIPGAALAIFIAVSANALVKWVLALLNGTRELAFWLGGGFATMLLSGALLGYICYSAGLLLSPANTPLP